MEVRITAGEYKGRSIKTPGEGTHPMGERERLALFNMIFARLPGATVLDAFAGSGALGIEALSRGATKVVFVEKSRKAAEVIRQNLTKIGVKNGTTEVICSDVKNVVFDKKFDVILADPPYDDFDISEVENLTKYLKDGGAMILSHPEAEIQFNGLALEKSRQYAKAHISIYTK